MSAQMLSMLPANISLLILSGDMLRGMKPIRVPDIFQGGTRDFHSEGLFSIDIFGKVGSEQRNRMFSFIDLKVPVMHPTVYRSVVGLKELYGKIMAGTAYASWDDKAKDFLPATVATGNTGYQFFMDHFHELKFEERESTSREFDIKLVYKERDNCMFKNLLVLPAGLRDYTIDESGKPSEDDINNLYRRIFALTNLILITSGTNANLEHLDDVRANLQKAVNDLYAYLINVVKGKGKMIQGWWSNRKMFNSTRNVITSNSHSPSYLGGPNTVGPSDTIVGLYQFLRAIFPLAVNLLRQETSKIFPGPNVPARLINKTTLRQEPSEVSPEVYDEWITQDGIETLFARFDIPSMRHDVIEVEGRYLALVYDDGTSVKIVHGIDELPDESKAKFCRPITYAELFYLCVAAKSRKLHCLVTRYPVINFGGIYPSKIYLKTTVKSSIRMILDDNWNVSGEWANEFPNKDSSFFGSMSVAVSHLGALGADN